MNSNPIISREEALTILKNDLRKLALERRSQEIKSATEQRRQEILAEIEREIAESTRRRPGQFPWGVWM
jgi:hypothetical protein